MGHAGCKTDPPTRQRGRRRRRAPVGRQQTGCATHLRSKTETAGLREIQRIDHADDEKARLRPQGLLHRPKCLATTRRFDEQNAGRIQSERREARPVQPPDLGSKSRGPAPDEVRRRSRRRRSAYSPETAKGQTQDKAERGGTTSGCTCARDEKRLDFMHAYGIKTSRHRIPGQHRLPTSRTRHQTHVPRKRREEPRSREPGLARHLRRGSEPHQGKCGSAEQVLPQQTRYADAGRTQAKRRLDHLSGVWGETTADPRQPHHEFVLCS
jgi:hypothetical protein